MTGNWTPPAGRVMAPRAGMVMVALWETTGTAVTRAVTVAVPEVAGAVKVTVATPLALVVAVVDERPPRVVERVIPRADCGVPLFVTVTVTVVVAVPSAGRRVRPGATWMASPEETSVQRPAWQRMTEVAPHCWPSQEASAQSLTPSLQLGSVAAPTGLGTQAGGVQTEGAVAEQVPAAPPPVVQAWPEQLGSALQLAAQFTPPPPPPGGVLKLVLLPQAERAIDARMAVVKVATRACMVIRRHLSPGPGCVDRVSRSPSEVSKCPREGR